MKPGRLTRNKEFQSVYKRGRSYAGRYMVLYTLSTGDGQKRIGFTVGKRIGGAVKRNLVRRRLKEAYRLMEDIIVPGYDLVIIGRVRALSASFVQLQKEMMFLMNKAGLTDKAQVRRDA